MTRHPLAARLLRWFLLTSFGAGVVVGIAWGGGLDSSALIVLALLAYVAVGLLVSTRRPGNPIGWVFLLIGFFLGISGWSDAFITRALDAGRPDSWFGVLGAWLGSWFWFPLITLATLFTVLLFPDGLMSRSWRPLLWVSVGAVTLFTLTSAVGPTLVVSTTADGITVPNPLAVGLPSTTLDRIEVWLAVVIAACGLVAVAAAVLRTRRVQGAERQQMKVFAVAAVIAIAWSIFGADAWQDYSIFSEVMLTLTIGLIPVACGVAIMRYHLYDIDRIISRTTSYAIVTGLVLATYVVVVAVMTRLLPHAGNLSVAAATLCAAALARPVLRRVQDLVDRRFNRARVDARRTVETFGARLQHEVDEDLVSLDLVSVVRSSLAPATVNIWVSGQP